MTVSIVIPALNEEHGIGDALAAAAAARPHELIVVDGGSVDRTRAVATAAGCVVLDAPLGRAVQMNTGAAAATGDVFLFLHADTRLPSDALEDVARACKDPRIVGGRFDVVLDGPEPIFRIIETLMNVRSRLTRIATGDQAIFVRRSVFEALGGFAPLPLMEDVHFSFRLKRRGRVACLRSRVRTSVRRWRRHGVWRTMVLMWWLRALYAVGVSPDRLARRYAAR
ncbi:MAG: TIGR04283 family arsenosugar biosynthesis glycosyltransferase [Nitrospirota bacterium]